MEIEMKYLVEKIPFDLSSFTYKKIVQSYVSTDPVIRIRQYDNSYFLTVKGEGHIIREEFEIEISKNQYENLLNKTENNSIFKTRYFIDLENNLVAELDIYEGNLNGLLTVEVEFATEKELLSFCPPKWFGKDISQDKRYKNNFLSKYGIHKK